MWNFMVAGFVSLFLLLLPACGQQLVLQYQSHSINPNPIEQIE